MHRASAIFDTELQLQLAHRAPAVDAHAVQQNATVLLDLPVGPTRDGALAAYTYTLDYIYIMGAPTAFFVLLAVVFFVSHKSLKSRSRS